MRQKSPSHSQRGSVIVTTAIALSLIVIALLGTEIGYLFYIKRELQKSADLAALAGAQSIEEKNCTPATDAAILNASQNLPSGFQLKSSDIHCGHWDPSPSTPPVPRNFVADVEPFNAVHVSIQRPSPSIFSNIFGSNAWQISLEAVATRASPTAAFSVGSRLIRVSNDSTLGALLKAIGLDLNNSTVLGYEGLANVSITPGDLLCTPPLKSIACPAANITVGGLNALLNANVTLGQLLDAIVTAGGRNDLLNANATLVNELKAKLNIQDLNVQLGSENGTSGVLALITTLEADSALGAKINVLDLIQAAIGVAANGHAVDAAIPINLLGLATVSTKIGIVEPPSVAIGSKGISAYTAQVRTYIQIQTAGILAALIKLNLPIVLDLVTASAKLEDLCTPALVSPTGKQRALFDVQGTIVKGCIGKISNSTGTQDCSLAVSDPRHKACLDNLLFSKKEACEQNLSNTELLNVLGLIKTTNSTSLNVLPLAEPKKFKLEEGQTGTAGNELAVGATVVNLVNTISNLLLGTSPPSTQPDAATAAGQIWASTASSVSDGGAGCTANTVACHKKRLENAQQRIQNSAAQSGLIDGLLNGVGDLLNAIGGLIGGDGCINAGLLGTNPIADSKCVKLLEDTLKKNSPSPLSGLISNVLAVATGLLKQLQPILDKIGSDVLTPLLQGLLGIHLGEVDVKLHSLQCRNAQLVY